MNNRKVSRKRHRDLISCAECHRRKQKCNRLQPCQHCLKRSKPELCRYECNHNNGRCTATNPSTAGFSEDRIEYSTMSAHLPSLPKTNPLCSQDPNDLVNILGYSAHSKQNTLTLVKMLEAPSPPISSSLSDLNSDRIVLNDKYRSVLRQLPSKEHIDILIQQFFSDINWHYDVIDEMTFRQQLENWRRIPYSAHSNAMSVLPADVLAFPSLLFQLMAHALVHQPVSDGTCASLESLKYASEMTFIDLACDLSEAGYSILETIGKKELTMVTVQSGILRASLLKTTGNVIEAWHVLGAVIRDSQEIGLHAELALQNPSPSIDAQWDQEMRRRIWFVLCNWDIHMAVVLGRPITTVAITGDALYLPDDLARRQSGTAPRTRLHSEPPTPFSLIRIGYDVAYRYFPRVHDLENRGARTEDYNIVQETHATVIENMDRLPLWCRDEDPDIRLDDPDIRFDEFPGCHWLPAARQSMTSGIYFVLLSLHRPYIFSVAESRTEALKAALKILTAQKRLFHLSAQQQYISFSMVYPSFDAMVISMAVIMLFPGENLDILSELVKKLCWGIHILSKIGEHNAMAQSAHGIVKRLFSCLEQSGGHTFQHLSHGSEAEKGVLGTQKAGVNSARTVLNNGIAASNVDAGSLSPIHHQTPLSDPTPADLPFEILWPPQPVHDLFYQDIHTTDERETYQSPEFFADGPEFDGHYPDNSFWSFMNHLSET